MPTYTLNQHGHSQPSVTCHKCARNITTDLTPSDLLDEDDKWVHKAKVDEGSEQYLEWYNAWMDARHELYVMYVAEMTT